MAVGVASMLAFNNISATGTARVPAAQLAGDVEE